MECAMAKENVVLRENVLEKLVQISLKTISLMKN